MKCTCDGKITTNDHDHNRLVYGAFEDRFTMRHEHKLHSQHEYRSYVAITAPQEVALHIESGEHEDWARKESRN